MNTSDLKMEVRPEDYKGFVMDSFIAANPQFTDENLAQMGITIAERAMHDQSYMDFVKGVIQDSGTVQGDFSTITPLQFAQYWIPEAINALYRGRTFDKIFGSKNVGSWELEQIVWTLLALTGKPNVYDDFSKANLASYELNFVTRDTIRFEMGIEVTELEQKRAAQVRQNAHGLKKNAVDLGFDILMNHTKWFGYASGAKNVYGLLNQDGITESSWTTTAWSGASCQDIITSLNTAINALTVQLAGNYLPDQDRAVLVLPLKMRQYMNTVATMTAGTGGTGSITGTMTPMKWLNETYPKIEVKTAPELDTASAAGKGLAVLYVPEVNTIGSTVDALDTSKLRLVGAVPTTKGFEESYSCSTAGVFVRCPLAVKLLAFSE